MIDPMRDEIIQVLLATRSMSEGDAADALVYLFRGARPPLDPLHDDKLSLDGMGGESRRRTAGDQPQPAACINCGDPLPTAVSCSYCGHPHPVTADDQARRDADDADRWRWARTNLLSLTYQGGMHNSGTFTISPGGNTNCPEYWDKVADNAIGFAIDTAQAASAAEGGG